MSARIRPARPADAAAALRLLGRLAAFEGAPDGMRMTEEAFRRDGFGPHRRFRALVAEAPETAELWGLAVLLPGYSSWAAAPTLTVHDLFVAEEARSGGIGRALLAAAARLGQAEGCCRLDVNVLAWNGRARGFYESLGFRPLSDWLPHRLEAAEMAALAEEAAIPDQ